MDKTIHNKYTSLLLLSLIVTGCTSAPTPIIPSGNNRVEINSSDDKSRYEESLQQNMAYEKNAINNEMSLLKREITLIKSYLVILQRELNNIYPANNRIRPTQIRPAASYTSGSAGETYQINDNSIVFRITYPYGKTKFRASQDIKNKILYALSNSNKVIIRGRTDAFKDNPTDHMIARNRAINAKNYLIENGVNKDTIEWSFLAYGDNIADNNTITGRALNRRVEIEVEMEDTSIFKKYINNNIAYY